MAKRKRPAAQDMVPHPRYGAVPIASGLTIAEAEIRHGHWRYGQGAMYPESVLIADTSKQNYSVSPEVLRGYAPEVPQSRKTLYLLRARAKALVRDTAVLR